jgi:hypothetical protein
LWDVLGFGSGKLRLGGEEDDVTDGSHGDELKMLR